MRRFVSLILLAFAGPLLAQSPFQPLVDRFDKFIADGDCAGAVLVVGKKDGVKFQKALGKLEAGQDAAMKDDSLFRIASMTKPMTAMAILMLQDDGKLSVDDAVEKHLPEFKGQWMLGETGKDSMTLKKAARVITLRDLLTHTSGLAAYPVGIADVYTKRHRTLGETTMAVSQLPLKFEPGAKWDYSNSGIDTLGRVVEVVSGQKFEDYLQKRLFDPLGMTDTTFYPTKDQAARVATLHDKKDGKAIPASSTGFKMDFATMERKHPIPAGGLFSCAADLSKLYRAMLHGGELDGSRVISAKAAEQMTQTQTGDIPTGFVDGMSFGFGWAVVKEPKGATELLSKGSYGHGGAFGTQAWIDPKQDAFFILLIQRSGNFGGDGSEMRKELQKLGINAMK